MPRRNQHIIAIARAKATRNSGSERAPTPPHQTLETLLQWQLPIAFRERPRAGSGFQGKGGGRRGDRGREHGGLPEQMARLAILP